MSSPKIVFSDIDGTLLSNDRVLSKATIHEFKRIKDTIPIILISARMPSAMTHLQKMGGIEHFPIIAYNGGLILINNKVVQSTEVSIDTIQKIIDFNSSLNIHFSLYNNNNWYVPKMDYWAKREQNNTKITPQVLPNNNVISLWKKENKGAHKIMCMGNIDAIDKLQRYLEINFNNELSVYRSKSTYIEISPKVISKKTAIEYIIKSQYPNISLNSCVAFGDNYNDIEMLQSVGYGVAVANAQKKVLDIAKYITTAGNQDGVAAFIKKNI